jgi:hypothetical protein
MLLNDEEFIKVGKDEELLMLATSTVVRSRDRETVLSISIAGVIVAAAFPERNRGFLALWSPHFGYLLGCIMSIEVRA